MRILPPVGAPIKLTDIMKGVMASCRPSPSNRRLEEALSIRFGIRHSSLFSSGRAALTILLKTLGALRAGKDEIAVPAYTSFSVPAAVVRAGFKVSLYDIDPRTLSPQLDSLARAVTDKTLCVIACHLYGYPCNMDAVMGLARENDIFVIDDAAQAMGAQYKGKAVGTFGEAGIFSLNRGKNITAVEGGAIISNSDDIAEGIGRISLEKNNSLSEIGSMLQAIAMYAFLRPSLYAFPAKMPGLKLGASVYNTNFPLRQLTAFEAGMGRAMLARLDILNDSRRATAKKLMHALDGIRGLRFVRKVEGGEPVYLRLPVIWDGKLSAEAGQVGMVRSYPYSLADIQPLRAHLVNHENTFPGAKTLTSSLWTLPTHAWITDKDISRISHMFMCSSAAQAGGVSS